MPIAMYHESQGGQSDEEPAGKTVEVQQAIKVTNGHHQVDQGQLGCRKKTIVNVKGV